MPTSASVSVRLGGLRLDRWRLDPRPLDRRPLGPWPLGPGRLSPWRLGPWRQRLLQLVLAPALTLVAVSAQTDPASPQQPGSRVEDGGDSGPLRQMQGKLVRAIQVAEAERPGISPRPLDPDSAGSFVRSLKTKVGRPFDSRWVSEDTQTLWSDRRLLVQGFAKEVDNEIVVTFLVERAVEVFGGVEFVGINHLDTATVDSLLGLTADRQVTRSEAEAMRKVLIARYRRDGYAFCGIEVQDRPLAEGASSPAAGEKRDTAQLELRFVVDEGPKVTVGRVTFTGNASFPSDTLFGMGAGTYIVRDSRIESGPARGFVNGGAFSREVIEEDLDRLRLFYRGRGFLDATVDLADVQFSRDRTTVDLSFVVVEGPRYRIRELRVEHVGPDQQPIGPGEALYSAEEIRKELKVAPGQFYDYERLQRDMQIVQDFYGRRGHPPYNFPGMARAQGCQVFQPQAVFGDGDQVDLVFQINEGVPKKLRDVVIRGNRFTRDQVIRRRIRVLPGDRIDMVEVQRGQRQIEQTRYFQDPATMQRPRLQLEPVTGADEMVDIALDLQDGSTGELRWGVGISTGQGAQAQLTFNKRNFDLYNPPSSWNPITAIGEILDNQAFHGGGQNLQMFLAPGSRFSQYQLTWIEPDVFGDHFDTYEGRVSGRRIIRRLPDGYTSDVLGAEVGLSRNLSDFWNVGASLRQETVEVQDLASDATSLAFDAEGKTELRGLRLSARYRDIDDLLRPTSGLEVSVSGEMIGGFLGGEESLTKLTHSANLYVPLRENEMGHRTVLHLDHFFGLANEFGGSDDVFLTERFYMGGQNLRGFDFRRAGPKQFNRPLGGEASYTATAEISFPLVATRMANDVRDRELLRWVLFTDIGFLGTEIDDPTFREIRATSGIGIRIEIPFLEVPIALDLGWPWLYEDSDDRRQLFFNIAR